MNYTRLILGCTSLAISLLFGMCAAMNTQSHLPTPHHVPESAEGTPANLNAPVFAPPAGRRTPSPQFETYDSEAFMQRIEREEEERRRKYEADDKAWQEEFEKKKQKRVEERSRAELTNTNESAKDSSNRTASEPDNVNQEGDATNGQTRRRRVQPSTSEASNRESDN